MNTLEGIQETFKLIVSFDDDTQFDQILLLYRKLDQLGKEKQKSLDLNSPYGHLFLMSIFWLLNKVRDRLSKNNHIEGVALPPQLKETLIAMRSGKLEPGSILWYENTFPMFYSDNPKNWEEKLQKDYDPNSDDYMDAIELLGDEICDPVIWKYRREAIPAAVFKGKLPELPSRLISDLKNLFGMGYFLQVVILSRVTLEASLKESLGKGIGGTLENLIEEYGRKKTSDKKVLSFMDFIRKKGNVAVHSLAHIKTISNQEGVARDCIIKLIYCMEDIYK